MQRIFQAATAENDNPDVRDRAYVYWRLLSSNPQVAQNVVLSEKPPITSTIHVLPSALLQRLLNELSTLASVYHKPAESFIVGADTVQKAAIEEQIQIARENPIAAATAAAATGAPQTNAENLLDIDFDGAVPTSKDPAPQIGLDDLMGMDAAPEPSNGISHGWEPEPSSNDMSTADILGGFGALSVNNQPKKTNDDLLGLF